MKHAHGVEIKNRNVFSIKKLFKCYFCLINNFCLSPVLTIKIKITISYIKVKVCMCVCVCMSGGLPPDLHNLSPQNLAWAPHFTLAWHRARGRPQMLTPGGTPIVTPSEKP